ncbi:DMP19 family protein [Virgisporangium aliadipatigenens]|uniref:DMP19 family protein n=1 Tax=Virgisporangium aliadipatigenens TaxID=741659 RepID=UPI0019436383|nr:DUF4375 domain-containing protein [Virgisporangium aliadipatigenens]
MVIDWQAVCGFDPAQLQRVLLAELDNLMGGLSEHQEDDRLAGLPAPLRVMWLLSWLDFEVTHGSLLAYFYNSHGRHAALAEQALRDIGAVQMADVLMRARQSVDAENEQWAAQRAVLGLPHAVVRPYEGLPSGEALVGLTDLYWAAADEEDWGDKLDTFLLTAVQQEACRDDR